MIIFYQKKICIVWYFFSQVKQKPYTNSKKIFFFFQSDLRYQIGATSLTCPLLKGSPTWPDTYSGSNWPLAWPHSPSGWPAWPDRFLGQPRQRICMPLKRGRDKQRTNSWMTSGWIFSAWKNASNRTIAELELYRWPHWHLKNLKQ